MPDWILGDKFDSVYPHKGSIKTLWENKWKFACQKSVYPFHDGAYEDFEPIFKKLIKENINDAYTDEYTLAFISTARSLEKRAADALDQGHHETASELYRRAAVVYRISRFPYVSPLDRDSIKRSTLEQQKQVYLKAASFWTPKIEEVFIPHTHRAGKDGDSIPLFVRVPEHANSGNPAPVVLLMTGLDGYRPDNSQRSHEIIRRGWATVICEIPGTADCPADPSDPESPDRLWSSVLDYIANHDDLDETQVAVWGLSAGGFYAIRAACTHKERLVGAIAHGAGSHHYLGAEWLSRIDDHEYPFLLTPAMSQKFGYRNTADFRRDAQRRFSLLENGILEKPSCRLLSLNGIDDGIVPIEDSTILFEHGSAKEARFFPGLSHMGYPNSLPVAYDWLESVLPFDGKE